MEGIIVQKREEGMGVGLQWSTINKTDIGVRKYVRKKAGCRGIYCTKTRGGKGGGYNGSLSTKQKMVSGSM